MSLQFPGLLISKLQLANEQQSKRPLLQDIPQSPVVIAVPGRAALRALGYTCWDYWPCYKVSCRDEGMWLYSVYVGYCSGSNPKLREPAYQSLAGQDPNG